MFRIAEFTCFPHKIESDFARTGQTTLNWNSTLLDNIMNRTHPSAFLLVHWELLLLHRLQLVPEVELGSLVIRRLDGVHFRKIFANLLLQLGELVLVLGNLFQCRLDAAIVKLSFMLEAKREKKLCWGSKKDFLIEMLYLKFTYNFPLRSLTAMLSSLIWRKQF